MNFEKPSSFENEKFKAVNSIEDEIIGIVCAPAEGQKCIDEWYTKNHDSLVEIFEEQLSQDPELLDKLNGSNRTRIVDVFMGELEKHKDEGLERAA